MLSAVGAPQAREALSNPERARATNGSKGASKDPENLSHAMLTQGVLSKLPECYSLGPLPGPLNHLMLCTRPRRESRVSGVAEKKRRFLSAEGQRAALAERP